MSIESSILDSSMELKFDMKKAILEINQSKSPALLEITLYCLEMAAVLDLIGIYGDINTQIINNRLDPEGSSGQFKEATRILLSLKGLLKKLPLS